MRNLAICIFVLCWAASPVSSAEAKAVNIATPVSVFFTNRVSLSIEQMKDLAARAAMRSGATNLVGYHCAINITVGDPHKAAVALFAKGMGQPYHQVEFTLGGQPVYVRSGIATDYVGTSTEASNLTNSPSNSRPR